MKAWQVGVTSVGATKSATMAWRSGGQLRVTVMVKSVFAFVPNETMCVGAPEDILDADVHNDGNFGGSLRAISDRYPFRPKVDVVFFGHAYAPGGRPAKRISARMAIANGNDKLLDKVIDVIGDRTSLAADPIPFMKMPLDYERAYGGPGFAANPLGRGFGSNAHQMPNIVYPHGWQRDADPASLGPIAATWPRRLIRAGQRPIDFLSQTTTEIPPHLDVSYFQCAPEDQRIAQLQGGEWILLENLVPTHAQVMTRLPDVRGSAMIFGDDGAEIAVPLRLDTLIIDGDREVCIVVCRGSHPVPNEAALDKLRIAAGVETNRIPIDWSEAKKQANAATNLSPGTALLDPNAAIVFKAPYAVAEPRQDPTHHDAAITREPLPGAPFARSAAPAPAFVPPVNPGAMTFVAPAKPSPAPSSWEVRSDAPTHLAALNNTSSGPSRNLSEMGPNDGFGSAASSMQPNGPSHDAAASSAHSFNTSDGGLLPPADSSKDGAISMGNATTAEDAHATAEKRALLGLFGDAPTPQVSEKKEWSWANSELLGSSTGLPSTPRVREAARPAEPPPRALIYSGFARKK